MKDLRIGASLAPTGLRWVEVAIAKRRRRLVTAGWIPREFGMTDADLLTLLRKEVGPHPKAIRILDDVHPPVIRVAELPPMPERDRRMALAHEAEAEEEVFGGQVDHAEMLLNADPDGSRSLLAILLRERLDELRRIVAGVGFELEGLFVGSVVLLDILGEVGLIGPRASTAVVDVGAARVNLVVMRDGKLNLIRQVHQGVDSSFLTGTDGPGMVVEAGTIQTSENDLLDRVDQGLLDLVGVVDQIRRTLGHTRELSGDSEAIGQIYLAGEAAQARSLAPLLQNDLRIPVEVLDPRRWEGWDGVDRLSDEEAPSFALTLALGSLDSSALHLSVGHIHKGFPLRRVLVSAGIAGAILNLLLIGSMRSVHAELDRLAQMVEQRMTQLAAQPTITNESFNEWVGNQTARLNRLPEAGRILDAIALSIPKDARLDHLAIMTDESDDTRWVLRVEGTTRGAMPEDRQQVLSGFVESLQGCGLFHAVRLAPLEYGIGPVSRATPLDFTILLSNVEIESEEVE